MSPSEIVDLKSNGQELISKPLLNSFPCDPVMYMISAQEAQSFKHLTLFRTTPQVVTFPLISKLREFSIQFEGSSKLALFTRDSSGVSYF